MICRVDLDEVRSALDETLFTVVDGIREEDLMTVCERLGDIIPYRQRPIFEVKPLQEHENLYSARSSGALFPHLDKYEWVHPPDTVALWCKQAASDSAGMTLVCDMRPFLRSLTPEEMTLLRTQRVRFVADDGLRHEGDHSAYESTTLDETDPERPRLRFSYNYTLETAPESQLPTLREKLLAYFYDHCHRIGLRPQELLLMRNTLLLHGRDSFTGSDRLLFRIYLRDRPHAPERRPGHAARDGRA